MHQSAVARDRRCQSPVRPVLSVVVPVRNEENNILPLLVDIRSALDGFAFEVIVVDDGSSDGTGARLGQAAALGLGLRHLRHADGFGQSAAICSGVQAAAGGWIATLDGDGQNDPADIPRLWDVATSAERVAPRPLLVTGRRVMRRDRLSRRLSSRIANHVRSKLLQDRTPDSGCGIKMFRREAFLALPQFDHMHRFLPALFRRAGGSVVSVPVNHRARRQGRSKYGTLDRLWVGLFDLAGVFWLQRRALRTRVEEIDAQRKSHEISG